MINTVEKLEKLLQTASSWYVADDATFTAVVNDEYDDDNSEEHFVPATLLAELHPDFAVALRAQIEWTEQHYSPSLPVTFGSAVMANLALQESGNYTFVDAIGLKHHLVNILNIRMNPGGRSVLILGSRVEIESACVDNRSIAFVTTCRDSTSNHIGVDELDQQFPGWKARWDLGGQLGMTMEELIPYILEKNTPVVAMCDIAFE